MLVNSIRFNSFILGICALITAMFLAGTHLGTKQRIADAERAAAQKALMEIVPSNRHTNDLLLDTVPIPPHFWATLGVTEADEPAVHIARKDNQPVAAIISAVAPDGYNGDIHLIIGINIGGADESTIAGVRIVRHNETPGLGDKVDLKKSDWVLGFNGKSLLNPSRDKWKVKKDGGDFDQFTGATITPRAVVNQLTKVLQYLEEDKQRLLKKAQVLPQLPQQDHHSEEANHG